ncbi:MAG: High-affinity branched-chain amino acid transport system permease protein LivH [Candidatus Dichloromethanomonas elyunquensis]|nr:MAG: High-affinity branched-chain amino acid transport system permease protein LivH [Candidatus Dichloromethanomonas elyunquensis]
MGVMDITNFAHGEYLMLSLYASFWLFEFFHIDPYLSVLLVIPLMFLLGLLTEKFLIRPTIGKPMFIHIFVTLGLSVILQNLALLLWSGNFRTIQVPFATHTINFGDISISTPRLIIFMVTLTVAYLIHLFLNYTWMGKAIRATSQNRNSAQLMGININRVFMVTFALGTACLGIAGPLLMPIYYVYPTIGFQFVLVAFVAVVMGGLGSVKGAVLASMLIGIIETLSGYFLDPAMKQAIYFLLFILVLIFKPSGIFGEEGKVV